MNRTGRCDWMEAELDALRQQSLNRCLRIVDDRGEEGGKWLTVGGRRLFNLSSNDYLGLAGDPRIADAARQAAEQWGAGAAASRLICGNHRWYADLEERLAEWKQREAALVFANGYMANLGVIAALVGREDAVFSDRLNHASIVDGIILSRARHYRYRHNDPEHLEHLLKKHAGHRRALIVTDAVFSMDGDAAPLRELVELKARYGAMLMVDEAHAGGVRGRRGEGLCHELGLHDQVDVIMGTFSKAFGVYGAYVCADRVLIDYLVTKTRPLIYSTGLPPMVVAAVRRALEVVQEEGWRRTRLRENSAWFRRRLRTCGFEVGEGDSPIIPWIVGDNRQALRLSQRLEERGIAAVAIRPPTVPEGTARIRFSLMATHTREELEEVIRQMQFAAAAREEETG
ncbi:8-amino-7-oxononanoate synthase [Brevibacillus sp. LEMMJ03]|uniref:8-amino-7-oxononanoate synthase n=1 Tax=Brevibacillus sp. LEMMJ03 TaxID=2595056 RepID=UPI0011803F13|nr:8-amino-7-oxononanoate synthase [Brevibacillus sp. LEMMJ03]TRY25744.1 8-amino-7-oxononanoate synthase [Brevibacillus sp. LEMMJ03]